MVNANEGKLDITGLTKKDWGRISAKIGCVVDSKKSLMAVLGNNENLEAVQNGASLSKNRYLK